MGCQLNCDNSDQALRLLCLKGHIRGSRQRLVTKRVARRCDDTSYQEASAQNHLFLVRVQQQKKSPKKSALAHSDALLMLCFQIFAAGAALAPRWRRTGAALAPQQISALRAVSINSVIDELITELIWGQTF